MIFAQKDKNDLNIKTGSKLYRVEVNAIQNNDFDKIKSEIMQRIVKIPTGKFFSKKKHIGKVLATTVKRYPYEQQPF